MTDNLDEDMAGTDRNKLPPVVRTLVRGFLIAMLLVGGNIAGNVIWEMYNPTPRIVTVDINGIVRNFVASTANSELSDKEKRAQTESFAKKLDTVLQGLAVRQHSVIFTAPAVIAGVEDITEAVKQGFVK